MRVAVLGLGEAGLLYAAGLADRGATVAAFDPVVENPPPGVVRAADPRAAVRGADVVASLVGASAAAAVARGVLPDLAAGTVYADMNTGSPEDKRALAAEATAAGALFADVAIMAPVPRKAELTPLLVSGPGAARLTELWGGLGLPVTPVGDEPGAAAGLKLVRSVFMKGLAAVVFESVQAGELLGAGDWVRAELAGELGPDGAQLVERLLTGTRQHAARREHEMQDARALLGELGAHSWMTDGTLSWLRAIAAAEA
ncbi:MAG: phosphogluconate dehydrogenase [Naasia sp.]|nr:phosphogluconate dehydrogenase [Naasia sp.]